MKIETKFDVNNFVVRKFDTNEKDTFRVLEVMEVISQTCYAGTQVFYLCRAMVANKEYEKQWKQEGEYTWVIGHVLGKDENSTGWRKYREDELIEAKQEHVDLILNGGEEKK
jgi:hypothetical protein